MERRSRPISEHLASFVQSPGWYQALTLAERLAFLPQNEQTSSAPERETGEQARKKLQRWKAQLPFEKEAFFVDRLAMDNMTEEDLLKLLAEPVEALQERTAEAAVPDWLVELARNLTDDASPVTPAHLLSLGETSSDYTLIQPFYPLLQRAVERLQEAITALSEEYEHLPFDPETVLALFFPNLARQLASKVSRAVVLELNVARLREQLQGETAQERFQSYLQRLGQREHLRAFLEEYCILARQLMITIDLWVNCHLECARALCRDWEQILETFRPEQDPGLLSALQGGAGDTHRNGHSVMILTFHSGWQLVYKPRSLSIDTHFQELLDWLNVRGKHSAFRTLTLLDKKTYGWAEFVQNAECTSEDEVRRFYERQGGYLALLYVLDAGDFHAENVIAASEHPLLIDLEALFHPRVPASSLAGFESPAQQALAQSVLRILLLPQRFWSNDEFEGVDMSGLGRAEGQMSPQPVPQWEDVGTDEMKLIRERVAMAGNKNVPRLRGQTVQALDFLPDLIAGFTSMYRLFLEYRHEFEAEILPRFAQDEVRFIARATRTYAVLLTESFHPNMLRNALKRDQFFDRLWAAVEFLPYLQRLIPSERADLFRGDIPLFTTYPNSRDLYTSQGERLPDFFPQPGIELVYRRLDQLGEEDLQRQIWLIHAAFTSTSRDLLSISSSEFPSHTSSMPASRERLLAEACAIGDRLCETMFQENGYADWIGLLFVREREWSIESTGLDLSSGLPGIILFLSYLGTATGETRYTLCARAALKTLRAITGSNIASVEHFNIGAFNGIGSCIYLFSHLTALWKDLSLLQDAEELIRLLPKWMTKDERFDIMDGSAGCIMSLLSLYAVSQPSSALTMAIQCGDHLLASAQSMEKGIGWKTTLRETPLTDFSHGAAGIALSLLKLADVSGEERFRSAAHKALAHERSLSPHEKRDWPDDHNSPQKKQAQQNQAHEQISQSGKAPGYGALGRALARLALLRYVDNARTHQEIATVLATLLEESSGSSYNHSLAYGDAGYLETLLIAARELDMPHLHTAREHKAEQLLRSIHQRGWIMGVPLNVETPGFLCGLAGIGYELLRLGEPDLVPSLLLLEPPVIRDIACS